MPIKKITLESLTAKASELFRIKGYHNTSINDIANACQLSKASVYHHVPSKLALGQAAIAQVHAFFKDKIFSILYREDLSSKERANAYLEAMHEFFIDRKGGCLIANLTLEVAGQEKSLDDLLRAYFDEWLIALTDLLSHQFERGEARAHALDNLCQTQGAIMLMRFQEDAQPLERANKALLALLPS